MIPTLVLIAAVIAYGRGDTDAAQMLAQAALVLAVVRLRPSSIERLWRGALDDAEREKRQR